MPAEGEPGGLLIVSDYPGRMEDGAGRPFIGETGKYLRALIGRLWSGPVAWDNAVRCSPGGSDTSSALGKCRCYLAQTIKEVQPTKVLAMGSVAIQALTGRSPSVFSIRRGYTWLNGMTPVFLLPNPVVALRNRFHRQWIEGDLQRALSAAVPYPPPWQDVAQVIDTVADAVTAAEDLRRAPWFAFDTETAGQLWKGPLQILCVACSPVDGGHAWVWGPDALSNPSILAVLEEVLSSPGVRKVGQNVKYDQAVLRQGLGIQVRGVCGDARLLRKLLDSDADGDLETMAELVGMGGHKGEAQEALKLACSTVTTIAEQNQKLARMPLLEGCDCSEGLLRMDVLQSIKPGGSALSYAYGLLPEELLLRYCARDVLVTQRLYRLLDGWRQVDDPGISQVYYAVLMPAAEAVLQIERWGMPVSREAVEQFHSYLTSAKQQVASRLKAHGDFDSSSTQDTARFLFRTLGLPVQHTTPSGAPSTDGDALEALQTLHPVVGDILEWRRLLKMDGTYATRMLPHICPDGRVHPNLLLDGARSGRMSCTNPNLQNIPRDADTQESKMARRCFQASAGQTLVSVDYSQLELRVAALLSSDPVMIGIFQRGEDMHQRTAELIAPLVWKIKPGEVKKKHRSMAKAFNFGVLYGLGDGGIAHRAGCSVLEAAKIREAIMGEFKVLAVWIAERLSETRRTGVAWTWWSGAHGRRRLMSSIADPDDARRSVSEHGAHNTPIQGTGSEFLVASMSAVVRWILDNGIPAKVCVPVHDSLVLEVEESAVQEVAAEVRRIMLSWDSAGVPLEVDVEVGPSWGDLTKLPLAQV